MGSHPSATALKAVADEAELIAGWEKEQEDIRSRISEVFCADPPPRSLDLGRVYCSPSAAGALKHLNTCMVKSQ